MLPTYFDYIFVHLRQKVPLKPELSPKFMSTLGPNPHPTRKARPDLQLWGGGWEIQLFLMALNLKNLVLLNATESVQNIIQMAIFFLQNHKNCPATFLQTLVTSDVPGPPSVTCCGASVWSKRH